MTPAETPRPALVTLELHPRIAGVSIGGGSLDLRVRITPAELDPAAAAARPPINLALVVDRSGSMDGDPLEYAKRAAHRAVAMLRPSDRVAVVTYDDQVDMLVPSTPVTDPVSVQSAIARIVTGGTTALHDGWLEGAKQVADHFDPAALNRVILLTDGIANRGETDPAAIGADAAQLAENGVSTSTVGLGRSFNEDLLETMAERGGGGYWFVETPHQLEAIFAAELHGLAVTIGREARLAFRSDTGAEIDEILSDARLDGDALRLPDLYAGVPIDLGGRIRTPGLPLGEATVGVFTLSWRAPGEDGRRELTAALRLPVLSPAEHAALPVDPDVDAYFEELGAMRLKARAAAALDQGDLAGSRRFIDQARGRILGAPRSDRTERELADLDRIGVALQAGDDRLTRKYIKTQTYDKRRGLDRDRQLRQSRRDSKGNPSGASPGGASNRFRLGNATVELALGDITDERVDAIVNPSNRSLFGAGRTVDGVVHRRGGAFLTRACRALGPIDIADAVFTDGYDLPARYVIHIATPAWSEGGARDEALLADAHRNALELAGKIGAQTLAIPAIGTGTNAYPVGVAARIAVAAIEAYARDHDVPRRVRLVLYDVPTREAYRDALAARAVEA